MNAPYEVRASGKTVAILSSFFDAVIRAKLEAVRTGAPVDIVEALHAPVTVLPRGVAPQEDL